MSDLAAFSDGRPIYLHAAPKQQHKADLQYRDPSVPQNYQTVTKKPAPVALYLDIADSSHFRAVEHDLDKAEANDIRCKPVVYEEWENDDGEETDAIPLYSAAIVEAITRYSKEAQSDSDTAIEVPFEKRGGKGMSRHLAAAATAATLAMGTASLGLFYNSLKAYDQDKYGVSKKSGLNDKSKDKSKDKGKDGKDSRSESKSDGARRKGKKKDDDGPGSPGSPTFINHITVVNNINVDPAKWGKTRRDCLYNEADDDDDIPLSKRGPPAAPSAPPAPAKGWHKYDHRAPFLEKVEDYGKVAAATGAFAAAVVASYSAWAAHEAYHKKEMKNKEEKKKDEDEDKHKRSDLSSSEFQDGDDKETGLVPSILPCSSTTYLV